MGTAKTEANAEGSGIIVTSTMCRSRSSRRIITSRIVDLCYHKFTAKITSGLLFVISRGCCPVLLPKSLADEGMRGCAVSGPTEHARCTVLRRVDAQETRPTWANSNVRRSKFSHRGGFRTLCLRERCGRQKHQHHRESEGRETGGVRQTGRQQKEKDRQKESPKTLHTMGLLTKNNRLLGV